MAWRVGLAGFATAVLMTAGTAVAAPPRDCQGPVSQRDVYEKQGKLEALIVGGGGKLYVSGTDGSDSQARLRQYAAPGRPGRQVAVTPEPGSGGLAWLKRRLLWGSGNTSENGKVGDDNPAAKLLLVNIANGNSRVFASGLGMANGVIRTPSGAIFASNDMGMKLDRISAGGQVNHGWAEVESANGLALSPNRKFIYANQTLVFPSSVVRIPLKDPAHPTTWFQAEKGVVFDGLTVDAHGSLYVAAWLTGEVWKIDRSRRACILARNIPQVSAVAFGRSRKGFRNTGLYAVSFDGRIVRIDGSRRATVPAA